MFPFLFSIVETRRIIYSLTGCGNELHNLYCCLSCVLFEKRWQIKGGNSMRLLPAAAPSVSRSGTRKLTKGIKMSDIDERL